MKWVHRRTGATRQARRRPGRAWQRLSDESQESGGAGTTTAVEEPPQEREASAPDVEPHATRVTPAVTPAPWPREIPQQEGPPAPDAQGIRQMWSAYLQEVNGLSRALQDGTMPPEAPAPTPPSYPAPARLGRRVRSAERRLESARQVAANIEQRQALEEQWRTVLTARPGTGQRAAVAKSLAELPSLAFGDGADLLQPLPAPVTSPGGAADGSGGAAEEPEEELFGLPRQHVLIGAGLLGAGALAWILLRRRR